MNSKPLRLMTLLTTTALLLAALAAGATAAPAASKKAKKCPQGKTAWKLDGGSVCLAGPAAAKKGSTGPAMAELWLREASRSGSRGKLRLSPALRRALPRAGELMAKELRQVGRESAGASSAGASGSGQAGSGRGPVLERVDEVIGQKDLGDGVVAEGRIRGRVFEDNTHDVDIELELRDRRGNAILYTPDYRSLFAKDAEVGCPTAAGALSLLLRGQMGGTVTQLKGKRVIASKTASQSWTIRARGQVGTDARLHSVLADVSMSSKNYERGLQHETTVASAATLTREGAPKPSETPTASVSVKAAGATRAEERAYELESARHLAGSAELSEALAGVARHARDRMLEAEPSWYALPNECAQIAWTPAPGPTLKPEQTRSVNAAVVAKHDGGSASGRFDVSAVGRGRFVPISPSFSAAGPASFIAASADPDAAGIGVNATVVASSTAGRAQATWFARATPVELPQRFVGTIASHASTAGLTRTFHGNATYSRTSVLRGPDGSLNAWYELTAAGLGGAKQILGPPTGCRLEANGTNGNIESGDLELRVLPDGQVVYALLYDLRVPSQFVPTDCPPDNAPQAFDGEIEVFLNSRRPGPVEGAMRPAGPGFELLGEGVGDVTDVPGMSTTASWTLVPG